MQMRWRNFILTGEDRAERAKIFDSFRYMGRLLYWSDNEFLAVLKNIQKLRQVWGCLGKFLKREGEDLFVL